MSKDIPTTKSPIIKRLAKCWVTEFGDNTVTYEGHGLSVTCVKFYKGLCKFEDTKLTMISVITNILV